MSNATIENSAPTVNSPETVDGTHNFRSTGGYAAGDRRIREGKLFRSDGLQDLTDQGRVQFAGFGIRRIIDLRDGAERERAASRLDGLAVEVCHNPVFDDGNATPGVSATDISLAGIYRQMLERHASRLTGAVRLIAESGSDPVLVHCAAGKDRTGLVIALALLAAGVDRSQVVADYATSGANLSGEWVARMMAIVAAAHTTGMSEETLQEIVASSPAPALESTLDLLDELHGGAAGLLKANGFSDDELEQLRNVLTTAA